LLQLRQGHDTFAGAPLLAERKRIDDSSAEAAPAARAAGRLKIATRPSPTRLIQLPAQVHLTASTKRRSNSWLRSGGASSAKPTSWRKSLDLSGSEKFSDCIRVRRCWKALADCLPSAEDRGLPASYSLLFGLSVHTGRFGPLFASAWIRLGLDLSEGGETSLRSHVLQCFRGFSPRISVRPEPG